MQVSQPEMIQDLVDQGMDRATAAEYVLTDVDVQGATAGYVSFKRNNTY